MLDTVSVGFLQLKRQNRADGGDLQESESNQRSEILSWSVIE
jgi:hypothetical protein